MSEYQYYEFLAVDSPLTKAQMNEVGEFSTRAEISSTSFVNEYQWGNFKGDPTYFLTHFFDAMVYVTNWGTRQFMFRVPRDLVDINTLEPYCTGHSVNVTPAGSWLIIDLCLEPYDGGGDYFESGSGLMASLIGIRSEVIAGDLRPLYLGWLVDLKSGEADAGDPQPPVPPGLAKLSAAQSALADFLEIDNDLIAAAAVESPAKAAAKEIDLAALIAAAPAAEKDRWLLELIETDAPHAALRLRSRLMAMMPKAEAAKLPPPAKSAGQLLETWQQQEREREEQQRVAKEEKRKQNAREDAERREKYLDGLTKNLPGAWRNVDQMIGLKSQEGYRQAVELLKDLKEIDDRPGGDPAGFKNLLLVRTEANYRKGKFIAALKRAGLM